MIPPGSSGKLMGMEENPYAAPQAQVAPKRRMFTAQAWAGLAILAGLIMIVVRAATTLDWLLWLAIVLVCTGLYFCAKFSQGSA